MVPARIPLTLDPARCDRCGRCMQACENGSLKVGVSYIYVDWRSCSGCLKCARACEREAIRPRADRAPAAVSKSAPTPDRGSRSRKATPRARSGTSVGSPSTAVISASGPVEWTLLEAWALLAVLLITFLGKDAIMSTAAVRGLEAGAAVFARVAVLFGFYALQVAVLLLFAQRRGAEVADAFRLRAPGTGWRVRLGSVALVAGLLVVVRVGGWAYGLIAQGLGWDPPVREVSDLTAVFGPTAFGLLLSVALVVIVAPLVEEVVFRGVLQGAFTARWGRRVGIGLAAGLFALYHFTPWLFVPLFALGVACGWLAESRRSLLPAISLHGAYNVIPVGIAFYLAWWA